MNILARLLEYHFLCEFEIFEKSEPDENGWITSQTRAFKKGYNKHKNNSKVTGPLEVLLSFIRSHQKIPPIKSYPIELNVHMIQKDSRFPENCLWAHLQGQKVGVVFRVTQDQDIQLLALGTHQEMGWR